MWPSRTRCSNVSIRSGGLAAVLAFAVLWGGGPIARAQDATDRASTLKEYAKVELALVEVVVLDSRGRHVRGLQRSAFRVKEGDRELPLSTFDEIDLGAPTRDDDLPVADGAREGDAPAAPADVAAAPGDEFGVSVPVREVIESRRRGDRWFVMLFDGYNNVAPRRVAAIRRAAKKWLDTNLRPGDRVAVFELTPYLATVTGFTEDKRALRAAIDRTRMFPGSTFRDELLSQRLEQAEAMPREFLEQQLLNAARFGGDLLDAERNQFYVNVTTIAEVMQGLRGTKAVLMFSGGFPLSRTRTTAARGGFTNRFRSMLETLEAVGIRVFTFDTGEEGVFTDASEDTNYRMELDRLGMGTEWLDTLQIGAQLDAANAHQEILSALGSETGGRFWRGRDYEAGLEAADDDLSHYYLVGYEPPKALPGERYRKVRISVDQRNLRVVARGGRFTPDAAPTADTIVTATDDVLPPKGSDDAPVEAPPLELACRPLYYPGGSGRTLVVLPIRVSQPLPVVSIGDGESVFDATLIVSARSSNAAAPVAGRRTVRLSLPPEAVRELQRGAWLREAMLLEPGDVELDVELRLNGLGRSGRWTAARTIPERPVESFGLTELALLDPRDATPLVYDVFRKGDAVHGGGAPYTLGDPLGTESAGRPPHFMGGELPPSVPLLAQVQVTAPPRPGGETAGSPLRMDWELVPLTGGAAIAPPIEYRRLAMTEATGQLDVIVKLDLSAVAPGDYTLRLTAENLVEPATDVRAFPLTVTEP